MHASNKIYAMKVIEGETDNKTVSEIMNVTEKLTEKVA